MEEGKDFMSNFGMMIPQGSFTVPKVKPIPVWKKVMCILIGHRWGFAGVTSVGPGRPMKCKRCKRTKWFYKYPIRMRIAKWIDKALDKLWTPLCKLGIHRFKHHYHYSEYPMSTGGHVRNTAVYKCSCCKKIKIVNL